MSIPSGALPLYNSITVNYNYNDQSTYSYLFENGFQTRDDYISNFTSGNFTQKLLTTGITTYELVIFPANLNALEVRFYPKLCEQLELTLKVNMFSQVE